MFPTFVNRRVSTILLGWPVGSDLPWLLSGGLKSRANGSKAIVALLAMGAMTGLMGTSEVLCKTWALMVLFFLGLFEL